MGVMNRDFWSKWSAPKYVLAPMVDASELAWRVLSRRYGVQLTYTPMIHAEMLLRDKTYRGSCLQFDDTDRPLIVQFCANNPDSFVKACQVVQPYCDAVDLNLGCPQSIAKRGHYGAFLQDEWELLTQMVKQASENLDVPVCCKIRVFPDVERTVLYAKMLETAGASLLAVHGRTREMKGHSTGLADWEQIRRVKTELQIPVIANGNIQYFNDVARCLAETRADAVMSAEGHLHNPALFAGLQPSVYSMSLEYLDCATAYPCAMSIARGHVFKLCHHALAEHPDYRHSVGTAQNIEELIDAVRSMQQVCSDCTRNESALLEHPHWICQPYERASTHSTATEQDVYPENDILRTTVEDIRMDSSKRIALQEERKNRRATKRKAKEFKRTAALDDTMCHHCDANFRSIQCPNKACGNCCNFLNPDWRIKCLAHRIKNPQVTWKERLD